MRRKNEFEIYLKNNHATTVAQKRMRYCEIIENIMGKDMEDLVASSLEINAAEKVLKAKYKPNAFKEMWYGFETYIKFANNATRTTSTAVSTSRVIAAPYKTYKDVLGLVVYENSVPNSARIPGLCEFIEKEYEKIREFARRVLVDIWQDFPAVPVYLSKERPEKTYYYDREFLLRKMREYCAKCERESCEPPYCRIDGVLEKYAPFTDRINGRYFDGIEPHIVLYFKNFDKPHNLSNHHFAAEISQTLAHEYWHFLHAYYVSTITRNTVDPFEDERVSEAMADFFCVLYSRERSDSAIVEERYTLWREKDKNIWPYAYALHFLSAPYKVKFSAYDDAEIVKACKKLRHVFKATPNVAVALDILTR